MDVSTDRRTNGRMDRPSYRDAWTHPKKKEQAKNIPEGLIKAKIFGPRANLSRLSMVVCFCWCIKIHPLIHPLIHPPPFLFCSFLVAYTRLYKSLSQFVGLSLGWSVGQAVEIFAEKLSKPHHCPCPPN